MDNLIDKVRAKVVLHGDFTLRSGRKADTYFDVKRAYEDPDLLNCLVDRLYELMLGEEATCVVGYGVGGEVLADVMSSRHPNLKLTRVRENLKDHGTGKQIEVYEPNQSDRVIIPDDVFTSGSSLKRATEIIKPTGARIIRYGVVVNREEGDPKILSAPLVWLMTARDILNK